MKVLAILKKFCCFDVDTEKWKACKDVEERKRLIFDTYDAATKKEKEEFDEEWEKIEVFNDEDLTYPVDSLPYNKI